MNKIENVVKGLRLCSTQKGCHGCPCESMSGSKCSSRLKRDALELLKEQKLSPRVLTLEELQKAPSGSLLWTEWKSTAESPMYPVEFLSIYSHTFPDGVTEKVIEFSHGMDYENMYGKQFRLWTAKPTDEQRKAVKWDD